MPSHNQNVLHLVDLNNLGFIDFEEFCIVTVTLSVLVQFVELEFLCLELLNQLYDLLLDIVAID